MVTDIHFFASLGDRHGFTPSSYELLFEREGRSVKRVSTDRGKLVVKMDSTSGAFNTEIAMRSADPYGGHCRIQFKVSHSRWLSHRLEEVLALHPNLRLWLENAAYPFLDEVIALMYRYPQVYADVSTITWVIPRTEFWRYLEALMIAGLGDRIVWGSDQMNWPGMIEQGLSAIEEATFLTEEQKRDILYNNAARFLRLSDAEVAKHHGR